MFRGLVIFRVLIIKARRGDVIDNKYHGMGRTELAASGLTKAIEIPDIKPSAYYKLPAHADWV